MDKKKQQSGYSDSFSDFLDAYSNSEALKSNSPFKSGFDDLKSQSQHLKNTINNSNIVAGPKQEILHYSEDLNQILQNTNMSYRSLLLDFGSAFRRLLDVSKPVMSENKEISHISKRILQTYLNLADMSRDRNLARIAIDLSKSYKSAM